MRWALLILPDERSGPLNSVPPVLCTSKSIFGRLCLSIDPVIPPFLIFARSRGRATKANFCLGVIPPSAIFGRS